MPTTENSSGSSPRSTRPAMAGISLRVVRSPDRPNTMRVPGGDARTLAAGGGGLAVGSAASVAVAVASGRVVAGRAFRPGVVGPGGFLGDLGRRRLGERAV